MIPYEREVYSGKPYALVQRFSS
uniref:Uncharacterized protein n=1 Tax=Arundo donax TaxID=35708 RepID=A0A0A8YAS2_ARUDO